jgi:hypothetical protein
MKTKHGILFGFAVLLAALFTLAGCSNPTNDPGNSVPTWTAIEAGTGSDQSQFTSDYSINGLAYGIWGLYVVGANASNSRSFHSSDGITWDGSGTHQGLGIAYGAGKYVSVGKNGKIACHNTDPTIWTDIAAGTSTTQSQFSATDNINGIAFGGGKFVAVGDHGKIAWSADGETWTAIAAGTSAGQSQFENGRTIYAITYGGGRFVAVADSGRMAWSADGLNWTSVIVYSIGDVYGIAYGGGKFVIGTSIGAIVYSTNGETWTMVPAPSYLSGHSIKGIAYGGGKFVAGGASGEIEYSADCETWTAIESWSSYGPATGTTTFIVTDTINAIAYANKRFVAVGTNGKMAYSNNQE